MPWQGGGGTVAWGFLRSRGGLWREILRLRSNPYCKGGIVYIAVLLYTCVPVPAPVHLSVCVCVCTRACLWAMPSMTLYKCLLVDSCVALLLWMAISRHGSLTVCWCGAVGQLVAEP